MNDTSKLPIGISMGDAAGVGPEVCLKAIVSPRIDHPLVLFGDASVLEAVASRLNLQVPASFDVLDSAIEYSVHHQACSLFDLNRLNPSEFEPGRISSTCGRACFAYIESAIQAAMDGKISSVATGPIHKEALAAAGFHYPGHTEIFIEKTQSPRACMMLTSEALTCSFVTTHVGYHEVPGLLTTSRILDVIELTDQAMRRIRKDSGEERLPQLLICGLNPHAGEGGLFGNREEEHIIRPAVEAARKRGIAIDGPVPPDTAFLVERRKKYDAVVCMYHDQGHIPLKALAFDVAVNTTLGLPIIRCSVDHGTAFDIAWKGIAGETSMIEALLLAKKLSTLSPG